MSTDKEVIFHSVAVLFSAARYSKMDFNVQIEESSRVHTENLAEFARVVREAHKTSLF